MRLEQLWEDQKLTQNLMTLSDENSQGLRLPLQGSKTGSGGSVEVTQLTLRVSTLETPRVLVCITVSTRASVVTEGKQP